MELPRNIPPYPVIIIDAFENQPSILLYYSRETKQYIFLSKKEGKDAIYTDKSASNIIRLLRAVWKFYWIHRYGWPLLP